MVSKSNSETAKVWSYVREFPGMSKADLVDALVSEHKFVSNYLNLFIRTGSIIVSDGLLYTVGNLYAPTRKEEKPKTSEEVSLMRDTNKRASDRAVPSESVLEDVEFVVKSAFKTIHEDVNRYIRGYTGRDGSLKIVIFDDIPKDFPDSTLWVVKAGFIRCTGKNKTSYWRVSEQVIAALEKKSGKSGLKFNGKFFTYN